MFFLLARAPHAMLETLALVAFFRKCTNVFRSEEGVYDLLENP